MNLPASLLRAALMWVALAMPCTVQATQLGDLRIEGIDGPLRDNVRRSLSLYAEPRTQAITPARLAYLLEQAPREVRRALEPFGHYDTEVAIEQHPRNGSLAITLRVTPGAPVRVREHHVRIEGAAADDPVLQGLQAAFAPKPGDILLHAVYEDSKRAIQRGLLSRGYFNSEVRQAQVEVSRAGLTADIDIGWHSGPRMHFGELRITGSPIDDDILHARIGSELTAGAAYDHSALLRAHQRLQELDYFTLVEVQPLPTEASGEPPQVPVDVRLEAAKRSVYRAGVSYGSDLGAGIKLGFDRRWLNRRGHKWSSELTLGQQRSTLAAQYRIPAFNHYPGWWSLGISADAKDTHAVDSEIVGILLSRSAEWRGSNWMAKLHVDRERYRDADGGPQRYSTLVYPALRFERKRGDHPLYPRAGYGIAIQFSAGSRAIGSDVDFAQLWAEGRQVIGIGTSQRLLLHAALGHTWGKQPQALPPSLRFFAGGDRSVRGYGFQELGPRDDSGKVVGGRNLLVAGVEYEKMFSPRWGGAVFVDAGDAFDGGRFDPALGVGIGLRWRSPVGPVRFDIAHGLDNADRTFRLHLTAGPPL